ncbi:MAG: tryptophan synthase subunit alpha [Eubacteriales bacterium]
MRIREAFEKADNKAFIPFITCGDPGIETTKELIYTLEKAGADIIELGIPFSDPTAEGPVIESANMRALSTGVTTDKIFDMVAEIDVQVPLVFMTYANVVFSYGIERFVKKCVEVGIAGIILPDIPFEEKNEFSTICELYSVDFISLIAPTSHKRISMIAKEAKGFVYCVSSMGVTGVRNTITADVDSMVALVREVTDVPVAIGFGISTPEQAKTMSEKCDGVIVGSAIVRLVEKYGVDAPQYVYDYVTSITDIL